MQKITEEKQKIEKTCLLLRFKKFWRLRNVLPETHFLDFCLSSSPEIYREKLFILCSRMLLLHTPNSRSRGWLTALLFFHHICDLSLLWSWKENKRLHCQGILCSFLIWLDFQWRRFLSWESSIKYEEYLLKDTFHIVV